MSRLTLTILSLLLSVVPAAAQRTAEGKVFIDANANGRYDQGEQLLAGIPVSDGCRVVVTDAWGHYRIAVDEESNLFPILPAGYTMAGHQVVNRGFIAGSAIQRRDNDFALRPKPVRTRFRLHALGDVQVSDYQEVDYASRTLWPELLAADSADVNLFLGDLVNNNLPLYPDLAQMLERLPGRSYTVLGNHDRDADSVRAHQVRSYCCSFGADVYAFNEGDVHFIVLNNVYGQGVHGYEGRLSERQLQFVRADLSHVPTGRLIVVTMHIPLAMTRNRDELFSCLQDRPVLALTAHLHRVMRFFYPQGQRTIHELGAGATCGFWWVGERDWEGVPMALQQGGTPRNYFVLDFNGPCYTFRCKGVGLDERRQMSIHITGIDTVDTHLRDMAQVASGQALITVWGGCDSTTVRCRIDGGAWQVCPKAALMDANAARVRELNLIKGYPTPYSRRNPMRRQVSPQLWAYSLPDAARKGSHVIEVEASDRFGLRASWRRAYCFAEADAPASKQPLQAAKGGSKRKRVER